MPDLTKREATVLGRLFVAQAEAAEAGVPAMREVGLKMATRLVRKGMIQPCYAKYQGIEYDGYLLTYRGECSYCEWAAENTGEELSHA